MSLGPIPYSHAGTALTGHLARPACKPRAALVLYPTIYNINPAVERRAGMLADAGFLVLVADFYGEPVENFGHSRELAQKLQADTAFYRARLAAALDALLKLPQAQELPVALVGYCMGGHAAIEMARDGADVVAAVSFHGLLNTKVPARPGAVKARLLVLHGDADPLVPRSDVIALWEEMEAAGANLHFHSYSGVRHGFSDPGSDLRDSADVAYDASADRQSWAAMMSLFDEVWG